MFHFHMHLIPRYEEDGVGIGWKPGTLEEEGERGNLQPDIAGASGIGSKDKRDMDFRGD